jgi:acyl carrier protein
MSTEDAVIDWLVLRIAAAVGIEPYRVPLDAVFLDLGMSSIQAVELSGDLERWTGLTLPPSLAYDYPTIEALARYVAEQVGDDGQALREPGPAVAAPGVEGSR